MQIVAREMDIALPSELTREQRRELIKSFVQEQFVERGMVADVAIHKADRPGDLRNHHAHVMLTMRHIDEQGFGKKALEWNDWGNLKGWREQWEKAVNRDLERTGHESRIDHRTLEAQREEAIGRGEDERALELTRAPQHHKGVAATNLERRGLESEKLERMRKDRPAERAPYLEARKEGQALLKELHGLQAEREREPEYQRLAEAQRQEQERRRQEEERKAKEQREFERARTDRKVFNALYARIDREVSSALKSCQKEVHEAIEARQKPQREQLQSMKGVDRELREERQWFEGESKKIVNRLLHKKEIEHDLSVIDEGRKQIAKEYDALNQKLQQERSPEKETPQVIELVVERYPGLQEQYRHINLIREEWQQLDRLERQKQWEREQKEQERDGGRGGLPGFGRGRGGPEIER